MLEQDIAKLIATKDTFKDVTNTKRSGLFASI